MHNPLSRYYHKNGEIATIQFIASKACAVGVQTFSGQNVKVQPDLNTRFFSNVNNIIHTGYPFITFPNIGNFDVHIIPTQGHLTDIKGIGIAGQLGVANQGHINIDNTFLKQFPNLEWFYFYSYQYGGADRLKTTISGDWTDIPTSIKLLYFKGDNLNVAPQLGDMSNLVNLETFYYNSVSKVVGMSVNVSGEIINLPRSLKKYVEEDENFNEAKGTSGTLTGKLSDFPPLLNELQALTKPNIITGYDSKVFPSSMIRIRLRGVTLTSSELDQFLIDISNVTTWTGHKRIQLIGSGIGVRTSASDTAITTLLSKGVTINITNN